MLRLGSVGAASDFTSASALINEAIIEFSSIPADQSPGMSEFKTEPVLLVARYRRIRADDLEALQAN